MTEKKCLECGTEFECCNTERGCWCEELPNIIPLTEDAKCLCRNCLEKKIALMSDSERPKQEN